MLCGLLLTKVFAHFKLNVSTLPYFPVKSTNSDKANRTVIPLASFPPPPPLLINLDHIPFPAFVAHVRQESFDSKLAKLQDDHDVVAESF